VDVACVQRNRRASEREADGERRQQRIRYRTDIARIRAVERRAVLEEDLPATHRVQPGKCSEALAHRLAHRRGAQRQCHRLRIGVRCHLIGAGYADMLCPARTVLQQH
jgi:hypothetical protein